ncbi:MAG: glycosyltransferase family 4 protein [Capsulimonadaceae bacterium]
MDCVQQRLGILQIALRFGDWGGSEFHILALSEELIRRGHRVVLACKPQSFLHSAAATRAIPTLEISSTGPHDWAAFGPLITAMREVQFDIVHAHAEEDFIVGPSAARLRGVGAIVGTVHMPYLSDLPHKAMMPLDRALDRIIAVSECVHENLLRGGGGPGTNTDHSPRDRSGSIPPVVDETGRATSKEMADTGWTFRGRSPRARVR